MLIKTLYLLTLVVWGEAPQLLGPAHQEDGACLVADVFMNWLKTPEYAGDPQRLAEDRFWGWQRDLPPQPEWLFRIVCECVENPGATTGADFVYSRQDLTSNGWTWHKATAHAGSGTYALYTFREIPEPFPEWDKLER